ncbi:MAG: F0F1 ATP synthase subunit A [Cytophagales bacterium]|nr:F0F1 ATP synthase subunit A [Cytophagales bacterium]MDW8384864.1 F0F1 ATP synthase subunit A [Flammeovirgaceae bacterium]
MINFWTLLGLYLFLETSFLWAKANQSSEDFNTNELIMHHVLDDHSWHLLTTSDGHHVSIPLPVILWCEGNLDIFMSSDFHHGEATVKKGDREYKIDEHNHIIELKGKKVLDFSITKNVASMIVSVIILMIIFFKVAGAYKNRKNQAPKGLQAFIEMIVVFIRDEVAIPNLGEKNYERYLPYLISIFFFIWVNNLLGLIPTGANASGNIAFTLTLAVFTLLITNFSGNKEYWSHIFWTPGVPLPLRVIMLPVEIVGIFTKPFALMIRLFANITAGHIIILSLISIIFIFKNAVLALAVGPAVIALTFLELFVAILQSYIFTLLSALFIGMAIAEHEHHDEEHHH